MEDFQEASHMLYNAYSLFERKLYKSLMPTCKHGKTDAQKKKEIAKRRKRKKNK